MTPIENAALSIINKNDELKEKIDSVQNAPGDVVDVGPLSMLLNGVIDAAVNGGTSKYISAFLCEEFAQEHTDDVIKIININISNCFFYFNFIMIIINIIMIIINMMIIIVNILF